MGTDFIVEELLPHRPPALFVTSIADYSEETISCFGTIPSDHPSVNCGFAPPTMAVELAAQAAGVLMGIRLLSKSPDSPPPRVGYLVSLKDVIMEVSAIPSDHALRVQVELETSLGPLAMFSVMVEMDEICVVKGHLGVAAGTSGA